MSRTVQPKIRWNETGTPAELRSVMRALGQEYPVTEGPGKGTLVRFERNPEPGVCRVKRKGDEAIVRYGSPAMAVRAVGALMAGLVGDGAELDERSPFTLFGIMLDCSRNAVVTVDHFKKWLRRLALLGYNAAMLYMEDTYELPGEKYFGFLRGAYTAEELKAIDGYASQLGIETIPCIQTLGHLQQILKWPAYASVKDTDSVLLADEEKTYMLIDKMLSRCADVFRSHRINIGMDEAHDLGRGRYMDRFGHKRAFDIFNRHLARVVDLCGKHGLKPVIWSDMYFRMGSERGDYYDKNCRIPEDVIAAIPRGVQLAYWDYYHDDEAFYLDWIQRHRDLGSEPMMASGVWTWARFWHDRSLTEAPAGACIKACRKAALKEIVFTLWGDEGGYCDFDSAFAGLTFAAEIAFAGSADAASVAARFRAVCKADYEAHCLASDLNAILCPSAVLWDDPLLGIYLQSAEVKKAGGVGDAEKRFQDLAAKLEAHAGDRACGNLDHARLVARALAAKSGLAHRLFGAYAEKDANALKEVRARIPVVEKALRELLASFRAMWLARNKPFGLEVMQIRLGGLLARYAELAERLDEYLAGKINSIDELDASLAAAQEGAPGSVRCSYRNLATASCIL